MGRHSKRLLGAAGLGLLLLATPAQARLLHGGPVSEPVARASLARTLCTFDRCGPGRGDSGWSLAGFGLAVLAAASVGGRRGGR
jgi:hypothetical protein